MSGGTDSSTSDAARRSRAAIPRAAPGDDAARNPQQRRDGERGEREQRRCSRPSPARARATGRWYWNDSPRSSVSVRFSQPSVLLGHRTIEAQAMALGRHLLGRSSELRRIVPRRELREQQRARGHGEDEQQRGKAAAEQEQGHVGLSVFRPFRPRELALGRAQRPDDVERRRDSRGSSGSRSTGTAPPTRLLMATDTFGATK